MGISAKEAAELTGMSKPAILKAIHAGKVSATKDRNGAWEIDPAELFRVYPAMRQSKQEYAAEYAPPQSDSAYSEGILLREIIEAQKETIRVLETQVDDLKQREVKLLEDKQAKGFWQRLFGQ